MKAVLTSLSLLPFAVLAAGTNDALTLIPAYPEIAPSFWETHKAGIITGGSLVLLGAFTIWALLRRKPALAPSPRAIAIQTLEQLRRQPEDAQVLSSVADALKQYVAPSFDFDANGMTTAEFSENIAGHPRCDPQIADAIAQLLRACDHDKFAARGEAPPLNAAERALELVRLIEQERRQNEFTHQDPR